MKIRRNIFYLYSRLLLVRIVIVFKRVRFFIFGATFILGLSFVVLNLTTIKHIEIKGINAVVTIDPDVLPNNLLFFPSERVRQLLKAEYPYVYEVTVEKKYPNTLILHIIPRVPIARIHTSGRSMTVSEDGIVLADTNVGEYPTIYTPSIYLSVGIQISRSDIRNALAFLAQMPQDEDIQSILIDDAGVLRVTLPAALVVLSPTRDGRESARTLQSVLTGFRIKGSIPKTIDLRFEQPVVTW